MKILNDQVTFDAADFADLSDFARKALPAYVGERADFLVVFADTLSKQIELSKKSLKEKTSSAESVDEVLDSLAAADQEKYDEALTAIRTVLGLPVAVVEPSAVTTENTEDPSLWTKLTSLFH